MDGIETILLAEDEELVRELTCKILEGSGYKVLTADSGEQALMISESYEGEIHLLITDAIMPGMTGGQLADRISALRPDVKVLYMSGYFPESDEVKNQIDPASFIPKPFSLTELIRKVEETLEAQS